MVESVLCRLAPGQAGAIWIGLLVTFLVLGDFRQLRSRRNLSLAAVLALAPLLVDILAWRGAFKTAIFNGLFLATALYAVWGVVLAFRTTEYGWSPNLSRPALIALCATLVVITAVVAFGRPPDDVGIYTNLGAQRWTETGRLPYADPMLKGTDSPAYGAAATYGPLLYVAHLPFQWILGPPRNPADTNPLDPAYQWPPVLATQLVAVCFLLIGLGALFVIVRKHAGEPIALAAVAIYAGSPYLIGLGGTDGVICGVRFASHVVPSAVVLVAFSCLGRPGTAGALLAAASGMLFYPAFMFPAWLGWYFWRDRRKSLRFGLGFLVAGALIATLVIAFTPVPSGENAVRLFFESTLEHQEGVGGREYGASGFGFWGRHPTLAAFCHEPLFGAGSLFKPTFLAYAMFALGAFFLARGRSEVQLAGLTAALAAAVQLWKTHATGTYVEWYLPLLLVALLAAGRAPPNLAGATPSEPTPPETPDPAHGPCARSASGSGRQPRDSCE